MKGVRVERTLNIETSITLKAFLLENSMRLTLCKYSPSSDCPLDSSRRIWGGRNQSVELTRER